MTDIISNFHLLHINMSETMFALLRRKYKNLNIIDDLNVISWYRQESRLNIREGSSTHRYGTFKARTASRVLSIVHTLGRERGEKSDLFFFYPFRYIDQISRSKYIRYSRYNIDFPFFYSNILTIISNIVMNKISFSPPFGRNIPALYCVFCRFYCVR